MVYTGKPSRGCQTCKSRRIKCDEERPTCNQCKKSGRSCPGYSDEFDLIFRNENAAVARRAQRGSSSRGSTLPSSSPRSSNSPESRRAASFPTPSSSGASPTSDSSSGIISFSSNEELQTYLGFLQNSLPAGLSPSDEVQATSFFFRNFVLIPREAETMRGFLEYLTPLYTASSSSSVLHDATHAVALFAFGAYPGRENLRQEAGVLYGQALQKVSAALKDPAKATADETLLAVMLFSLYEAIASAGRPDSAWNHHVEGAVALVKLRGPGQFKNPLSYNMFRAVRSMMLTNCIQHRKPLEELPGGMSWVGDGDSTENAANRLTIISMDLPAIRTRYEALRYSEPNESLKSEARSLFELVKKMDADLLEWVQSLPPSWQYKIVSIAQEITGPLHLAEAWTGPQHTHEDLFICSIVNDYRVSRIFCQSIISRCVTLIQGEGPAYDSQLEIEVLNARFVTQQMVDEICATVPFNINFYKQGTASGVGQDDLALRALGAYLLAWPLYICSQAPNVPPRQLQWIQGRLLRVARAFGLNDTQVQSLIQRHVLTNATIIY